MDQMAIFYTVKCNIINNNVLLYDFKCYPVYIVSSLFILWAANYMFTFIRMVTYYKFTQCAFVFGKCCANMNNKVFIFSEQEENIVRGKYMNVFRGETF